MTTQKAPARIARITAVVIIVVALLAAGVSSVVVTLWVLLMAVPVLATLRLALNLLDGAAQDNPARVARIMALAIIGVALLAAGVSSVMTLWASSFARFMYLEDLGLEGTTAGALAHITPVDRGLLISGGILALLGAAALVAAVLARYRARAGR
jgi:hypothetical protein